MSSDSWCLCISCSLCISCFQYFSDPYQFHASWFPTVSFLHWMSYSYRYLPLAEVFEFSCQQVLSCNVVMSALPNLCLSWKSFNWTLSTVTVSTRISTVVWQNYKQAFNFIGFHKLFKIFKLYKLYKLNNTLHFTLKWAYIVNLCWVY